MTDIRIESAVPTAAPRRVRRRAAITGALVGALMLPAGIAAAGVGLHVNGSLHRQDLLPAGAPADSISAHKPYNLLFITQSPKGARQPAASIFMVHISADRHRVDLVHVPTALRVKVAGHGTEAIGLSYPQGGARLTVQATHDLLGVPIAHVAVTDINGLKQVVDSLGGVSVNGSPVMNGEQALAWIGQEQGQGIREEQLVRAVIAKGLSTGTLLNPAKGMRFLNATTRSTTVDKGLTGSELVKLGTSLRNVTSGNIVSHVVPWTTTTVSGRTVVVPATAKLSSLDLHLQGDTMASYTDTATSTISTGSTTK